MSAAVATTAALGTGTTVAGSGATADQQAARQAYTDCLAKNGVTITGRGGFGGGQGGQPGQPGQPPTTVAGGAPATTIDPVKLQAAQAACASLRPVGGFGAGGNAAGRQAFQAYLSCLSDHGVVIPTTTTVAGATTVPGAFPGGPGGVGGRQQFDQNDPTFQAANKICAALLPARANGAGATTSTTTNG